MGTKRNYKQYTNEFKEEAVLLVTQQGYTVAEAAKSLGIASSMLYNWKSKFEEKHSDSVLNESEKEELKRLHTKLKKMLR